MVRSCFVVAAFVFFTFVGWAADAPKDERPKEVDFTGTLETGVIAIGGETTGIIVRAKDAVWELDLGHDADLKRICLSLNNKGVRVVGKIRIVPSVEVPQRRIVLTSKVTGIGEQCSVPGDESFTNGICNGKRRRAEFLPFERPRQR